MNLFDWLITLFAGGICAAYTLLCLCIAAKRGDEQMSSALGIDLAQRAPRSPANRRTHRLAFWLSVNHAVV